jgi:hypothetical protein
MITFVRTATALPGKTSDLMAFAKESVKVIKQAIGVDVSVNTAIGGAVGTVGWVSVYENLAQLEEKSAKLMADAEYGALLKRAEGVVLPGSTQDRLWRSF